MLKCLSARATSRVASCALAFLSVMAALGGSTSYAGQIVYEYDDAGRLKRVIYPNANERTYKLDAAGNRTAVQVAAQVGGTVSIQQADYTVNEDVGTVTIVVTRAGTSGAVTVQYATANGTAIAGSDFSATSGTLSWANGDNASKSISIPITNDTTNEGVEAFTVTLSAPTGGAMLAASVSTITINDNDTVNAVPIYRFRANNNWAQHLYTRTIEEMAPYTNWIYEGVAFYLYPSAVDANTVPVYHCYVGGTNDHFLTPLPTCVGYTYISLLGYASSIERPGTIPLYEFYHYGMSGHMTTTSYAEGANNGFTYLGSNGQGYLGPDTSTNAAMLNTPLAWGTSALQACAAPNWCAVGGDLSLSWNSVVGATRYELERSYWDANTGAMTPFVQIYSGTNLSQTIAFANVIANGDTYRVRACTASACGAYSVVLNFYLDIWW